MKNRIDRKTIIVSIVLGFATAFTTLLFIPLDLYLRNANEFIVSFQEYFQNLFVASFILAAVLSILLVLISILFKRTFIDVLLLLMCGGLIASHFQNLFLNGEMVSITGDVTNYTQMTPGHIFNFGVFIVLTALPLCVWKGLDDKGKEWKYQGFVAFCAMLIFGMQIVGLISTYSTVELKDKTIDMPKYFSYDPEFVLSEDENICVFLLDRLDGTYMQEVLQKYPELEQQLDGFTFYENNVAEYTNTFPSVPKMLTNCYYDEAEDKTWEAYWERAWQEYNFMDALKENGYVVYLGLDGLTTFGSYGELEMRADNIKEAELSQRSLVPEKIIEISWKLSLAKTSPYMLKDVFLVDIKSGFGNEFVEWALPDMQYVAVSNATDIAFYNRMKQIGVTADNDNKVFLFQHFNCAHDGGYHYDPLTQNFALGGNYEDAIYADFQMLDEYFSQMKELGIYDNSTIILLGDHGRPPIEIEYSETNTQLNHIVTTALLIKPKNASGPLKVDAESELSNAYFAASILDFAGIAHEEFGDSYFDIIENKSKISRNLYLYRWRALGNVEYTGRYVINGDANDFSNWEYIFDVQE